MNAKRFIRIVAVLFAAVCVAYAIIGERVYHPEEVGFLNAAYMIGHYSQVRLPAYEALGYQNWDMMFTHPPTHHIPIGIFYKFMPLHYALAIVPTFCFLLAMFFATTLKVPLYQRLAYLLAGFCLLVSGSDSHVNFTARPELTITLAWFAGMLALEKSRTQHWNKWYFALGSFLIVFAGISQFFAFFCMAAIPIYLYLAFREQSFGEFKTSVTYALVPALFLFLPFLIFYIIPFFDALRELSQADTPGYANIPRGPISNLMVHLEVHRHFNGFSHHTFAPAFLHRNMIPVGLVSVIALLFPRTTRFFAIGSIPFIFYITFMIKVKKNYYIFPEWLLYYLLVFSLGGWIIHYLTRHKSKAIRIVIASVVMVFLFFIAFTRSQIGKIFTRHDLPQIHLFEVARAAAQTVVGHHALIGGMLETWYVSGGKHWYNEESDFMIKKKKDIKAHLNNADFFAVYDVGDIDTISNPDGYRRLLPGYYETGDLQFNAMIFGPNRTAFALFSSAEKKFPQNPKVFVLDDENVSTFTADGSGAYVMGIYSSKTIEPLDSLLWSCEAYLPLATGLKGTHDRYLGIFLTSAEHFTEMQEALDKNCTQQELYKASKERVPHSRFCKDKKPFDRDVHFYLDQDRALQSLHRNDVNAIKDTVF